MDEFGKGAYGMIVCNGMSSAEVIKTTDKIKNIEVKTIFKNNEEAFNYCTLLKLSETDINCNDNIIIYNETADAGIITINVKGVFPQDEASYLNSKGICVRSGEHCAKLLKDLLKTVGTVRISFYFYNTFEEIDTLYEALKNGGDFLDAYFN